MMRGAFVFVCLITLWAGGCATPPKPAPPAEAGVGPVDEVQIVRITPSADALLAIGEQIQVDVECRLVSQEGAFLLVRPYQNGIEVEGFRAHVGIPMYKGDGRERGWIRFDTVADVDEIRATLTDQRTLAVLAADSRTVDLRWRAAEGVTR